MLARLRLTFPPPPPPPSPTPQLAGTIHCDYPSWIEFLCFDINVHVPHHVNSKIPWYNLRNATDSLRKVGAGAKGWGADAEEHCCL